MNRQYIRDNQVVERYLQGRLTADEKAAFEEAYLGDAELVQELKTADLLRRGLEAHDAAQRGEQRPSAAARSAAAPRYALAASLVAGIALASRPIFSSRTASCAARSRRPRGSCRSLPCAAAIRTASRRPRRTTGPCCCSIRGSRPTTATVPRLSAAATPRHRVVQRRRPHAIVRRPARSRHAEPPSDARRLRSRPRRPHARLARATRLRRPRRHRLHRHRPPLGALPHAPTLPAPRCALCVRRTLRTHGEITAALAAENYQTGAQSRLKDKKE